MNIDPREWELQERALREDAAYREVDRALRRSPGEPPTDFAAAMAALVAQEQGAAAGARLRRRAVPTREGEVERWLVRALSAALALAGIGMLARTAREWLGGFDAVAAMLGGFDSVAAMLGGPGALNWALAAAACVALSWAFAQGGLRAGVPRH